MSSLRLPQPTSHQKRQRPGAQVAALKLLARRDFAVAELHERLLAQGYDEDPVQAAIAELVASGALNDARYAQNYVAYQAGRGQGPYRIGAELRGCGVAPELVTAALAGGPDWSVLARHVCRGKFGAKPPENWPEKARQARFLQYRGFSSDHIRAATGADPDLD
jgi:regulatory protein